MASSGSLSSTDVPNRDNYDLIDYQNGFAMLRKQMGLRDDATFARMRTVYREVLEHSCQHERDADRLRVELDACKEKAAKWDALEKRQFERAKELIDDPTKRWVSDKAFVAACEAAVKVPSVVSIADVNNFQDALRLEGFAVLPLSGDKPSESDAPTDAPDPGEGWRLINKKKDIPEPGDQVFTSTNKWVPRQLSLRSVPYSQLADRFYRRRIVMTQPPSEKAKSSDKAWFRSSSGRTLSLRLGYVFHEVDGWHNPYIAWCHKLPGETEPPQMLRDWKPEGEDKTPGKCAYCGAVHKGKCKLMPKNSDKPAEPTTQRRDGWIIPGTNRWTEDDPNDPMAFRFSEQLPGDPSPEEVAELRKDAELACEWKEKLENEIETTEQLEVKIAGLQRERDELRMELITSHGETQTALEERDALQARVDAVEEVAGMMERWCNQATDVTELCTVRSGRAPRKKYVGIAVGLLKKQAAKLRGEG